MEKHVEISKIIDFLRENVHKVYGICNNITVSCLSDIEHVNENTLDWISPHRKNKLDIAEKSKALVIVVGEDIGYSDKLESQGKVIIVVDDAKKALAKVANEFWIEAKTAFVHPAANIDKEARVDSSVYIGAGCAIGKCSIGSNTVIHPNVTIYDGVTIGKNCIIHSGVVIGTDGLGCQREIDGSLVKFPHFGGVIIGNDVEIGANSQIARGALSDTIIGDGCKINGLCFIAHNCILGKNVWITGDTMLATYVKVEDNVTIFSKVIVREQVCIGMSSIVGMGSVVTKSIPANEMWLGVPAKRIEK